MAYRELSLPGESAAARASRMLRVDHAGEAAAKRIYEGQLAVLKPQPKVETAIKLIAEMAAKEETHLAAFEQMITKRRVRPTLLGPIWDVAAYGLGAASALLGPRAAMACTVAVEEAICAHYRQQLDELGAEDPELSGMIAEFSADEMAHRQTALASGAEQAPAYRPLSEIIKAGCRLAIRLSERI